MNSCSTFLPSSRAGIEVGKMDGGWVGGGGGYSGANAVTPVFLCCLLDYMIYLRLITVHDSQ